MWQSLPDWLKTFLDFRPSSALRDHVKKLEFELNKTAGEKTVAETKLAQAQAKMEDLESDVTDLKTQLDAAEQEIKNLKEVRHVSLGQTEVRILEFLAGQAFPMAQGVIQHRLNISRVEAQAAIAELKERNLLFIHRGFSGVQYRLSDYGAKWVRDHRKQKSA